MFPTRRNVNNGFVPCFSLICITSHNLVGINNKYSFLIVLGSPRSKGLAGVSCFTGLEITIFFVSLYPFCRETGTSGLSSYKATHPILGDTTSSKPKYLSKTSLPNPITLMVRVSTYHFVAFNL